MDAITWRAILISWSIEALFSGDVERSEWLDELLEQLEAAS